jgi:hypothetical protein
MYFEDLFNPNEMMNEHAQKEINAVKSYDSGYGYVHRKKLLVNGTIKNTKIDCYTSGDSGTLIRNAETGNYYKFKVGSKEEELLFKIALATGELKTNNGSNVLFYDSPEQYEKHLSYEINQNTKDMWYEKKMRKKGMN